MNAELVYYITDIEGTVGYIYCGVDGKKFIVLKENIKTNRHLKIKDLCGKEIHDIDIPHILLDVLTQEMFC